MRQVPTMLIIANGRMAQHFAHYLWLLKISFLQWHRNESVEKLQVRADKATHILLLISDDAIEEFIARHDFLRKKILIIFSGHLSLEGVCSVHPLMTFADEKYSLETYQRIPFILEKGGPSFSELMPGLANPHYFIPRELKPFYHALCVIGGNFTCLLWQKVFNEFETKLGLPVDAILPYMQQVFENLKHDPNVALTGPLVRGDENTMAKHLDVLEGDAFFGIYKAFQVAYQQEKTSHL